MRIEATPFHKTRTKFTLWRLSLYLLYGGVTISEPLLLHFYKSECTVSRNYVQSKLPFIFSPFSFYSLSLLH